MATSRFGQRVQSTQQQLLEQLVLKLLGNETTLSARRKAVGICQHRLRFNAFPDTNPDNVLIQFNDVCEILKLESRERELARLHHLKEQFFTAVWESDVLDLHSSILRFLLSLTGALASSKAPMVMEVDPVSEQDPSISSESDLPLSEWSEESDVHSSVLSEDPDNSPGVITKSIPWNHYFLSRPDPLSNTGPVLGELDQTGSLLNSLAEVQFTGPDSLKVCSLLLKTEHELVMNCMRVLQGESGSVFTWVSTDRTFTIDHHLQNHHYSAVAMRSVLSWFGRAGSLTRDLLDWSNHLLEASGRQELASVCSSYKRPCSGGQNLSPTLSACAQAIHHQLESILSPFIQTEEELKSTQNSSKFTLIWIKHKSKDLVKNIELLHRLKSELKAFQRDSDKLQSVLSCEILDKVYDWCLEQHLMGSTPSSGLFMIWRIFSETLRPFLSQLTAWLFLGDTPSISKGFLVSMEEPKRDENLNFWTDAFPIRSQSCPKFLNEVLGVLHDGGKALQMLRNQEYKNPFGEFGLMENSMKNGRLEELIDDQWTKDLLHQKFTEYLSMQFSPIKQNQVQCPMHCPSDDDEISFFTQMANLEKLKLPNNTNTTVIQSETGHLIKDQSQDTQSKLQLGSKREDVGLDEDSTLPASYTRVLESMEAMEKELCVAMDISQCQQSVLYHVLPDPVNRKPYSKLHDKIFASSKLKAKVMDSDSEDIFDCLAPPPVIIKEGLLNLIQDRSLQIMKSFISCLLTDLGLMDEILVIKNVFLMGSPAINEWTRRLVEKLNEGHLISNLGEYQLILDMQECFAVCSVGEKLPVCGDNEFEDLFFDMREIDWERRFPNQETWIERSPQELDDCGLVYPLEWPLCLLVNDLKLKKYNTVFLFLLKLQWTCCAIKEVSMMAKKKEGSIKGELLSDFNNLQSWRNVYKTIHEMSHFLSSLRRHVFENIHHTFDTFQKSLLKVESIREMQKQHDEMLDTMQRFSFQSRKKQWKTVHSRLLTLFHSILNFCSLWKHTHTENAVKVSEVLGWMNEVVEEYKDARSSTMMILHIYSYSLGGNRELNDLITMLNFNQIYVHYDPAVM